MPLVPQTYHQCPLRLSSFTSSEKLILHMVALNMCVPSQGPARNCHWMCHQPTIQPRRARTCSPSCSDKGRPSENRTSPTSVGHGSDIGAVPCPQARSTALSCIWATKHHPWYAHVQNPMRIPTFCAPMPVDWLSELFDPFPKIIFWSNRTSDHSL